MIYLAYFLAFSGLTNAVLFILTGKKICLLASLVAAALYLVARAVAA